MILGNGFNLAVPIDRFLSSESLLKGGIMKSCGLIKFIKGDQQNNIPGCCNYDHYYGGCLFDSECKIEAGKRCGYFEKAVLPIAQELGISEQINAAYADKVGLTEFNPKSEVKTRRCECGAILKPRHRYCEKCSKKHRRQGQREWWRKKKKR
jgi:hypothetical protein